MLALDLLPGSGLGSFSLGCSLNSALITAKQARNTFGCVELKYFEHANINDDILLNLPEHGLHLSFDNKTQRLQLIEVYDLSRLQVKRGAAIVGGSAHPPSFEALYDLMGPTYPGQVDTPNECYVMHWPGLVVLFPIAAQHAASWQNMQQGGALPLALPTGTAPVASRLCIHAGNAVTLDELAQARPPPLSGNPTVPTTVAIRVGHGLILEDTQQQLSFGATPQDAWSALGVPTSTFSKQPSSTVQGGFATPGGPQQHVHAGPADYFYNYFDRGLDVLFCGVTHRIKKLVLHTNLPSHASFGTYNKCHFTFQPASASPDAVLQPTGTKPVCGNEHDPNTEWLDSCQNQLQHSHNHEAEEAECLCDGQPLLQPNDMESQLGSDLPVQDWLRAAGGEHGSDSGTYYSSPAPAARQQALLDDIKAMTREDSDSASSDSSQMREGNLDLANHRNSKSGATHPPGAHLSEHASLDDAAATAALQEQQQHGMGSKISATWMHQAAGSQSVEEELHKQQQQQQEQQQQDEEEEGEARAEPTGRGDWTHAGSSVASEPFGHADLEGWDDEDPMAMLSQSVQSLARAQQAQSERGFAEPDRHSSAQPQSAAGSKPQADMRNHTESTVSGHSSNEAAEARQAVPPGGVEEMNGSDAGQILLNNAVTDGKRDSDKPGTFSESAGLQSRGSSPECVLEGGRGLPDIAHHKVSNSLPTDADHAENNSYQPPSVVLTADSTWAQVESVLGKGDRAVIHSRGPGGGLFGPTMVHGYPGIVFEVTQAGRIASVTLFQA